MTLEFTEKDRLIGYICDELKVEPAKVEAVLKRRYPRNPISDGVKVTAKAVEQPEEQIGLPCFSGRAVELHIAGKEPIQIGLRTERHYNANTGLMDQKTTVMTRAVDPTVRCQGRWIREVDGETIDKSKRGKKKGSKSSASDPDEAPTTLRSGDTDFAISPRSAAMSMLQLQVRRKITSPTGKSEPAKNKV